MAKKKVLYTASDGKMVITLEPAEEGGYVVTSPLDPGLVTEAETIEEAFVMAYDAAELLRETRAALVAGSTSTTQRRRGTARPVKLTK